MAVARALDSVLEPAVGNDDPDELLTTRRKGRSLERPLFGAALFGIEIRKVWSASRLLKPGWTRRIDWNVRIINPELMSSTSAR